jgi:hypothetical protein
MRIWRALWRVAGWLKHPVRDESAASLWFEAAFSRPGSNEEGEPKDLRRSGDKMKGYLRGPKSDHVSPLPHTPTGFMNFV